MAFHNVRFPTDLSFGALGGPERRTDIVTLTSGYEERNSPWAHGRRRYDAGFGLRSLDDITNVIAFFEARHGRLHSFRWKDWADYASCLPSGSVSAMDQPIGTGDGATTEFQLQKSYASGGQAYVRPISNPIAATVRIAVAGSELGTGVDFTVDDQSGVVSLSVAPAASQPVTAGFEFDVPVRFDTDQLNVSVATFQAGSAPNIPVTEVRQ